VARASRNDLNEFMGVGGCFGMQVLWCRVFGWIL
jgi:hypothetical protein